MYKFLYVQIAHSNGGKTSVFVALIGNLNYTVCRCVAIYANTAVRDSCALEIMKASSVPELRLLKVDG